ncbi:MAG: DUF559 domain-containing protein [Micropruina sp.]|uniref:endonuclease domain-containing protein n=1 Tax=Micropruina sp. TaxID=2737536 RepID=UPI0039E22E13
MERIFELLRAEHGVLSRRRHASIAGQLDWAVKQRHLKAILPGIYTTHDPTWEAQIRAVGAFRPDCVITGAAAAMLLWWPECPIDSVSVAVPDGVCQPYSGFNWERRSVAPDLIVERDELRIACPELSVLDLIPVLGGRVIDEGLRRGAVTLQGLWDAFELTRRRRGNALRRELLHDSRDEPWSEAERTAHRLLRAAGIVGWRTNYRITIGDAVFFVDIAFPALRLVIEIDGWEFHGTRAAFTRDRWRYARLGAATWTVLPFAAEALDDPDEFIAVVRTAMQNLVA